MVVPVRGVA